MKLILTENQHKNLITESTDRMKFLGYYSTDVDIANGWGDARTIDSDRYVELTKKIYNDFFELSEMSANEMEEKLGEKGITSQVVTTNPMNLFELDVNSFKYGNKLYKVYSNKNLTHYDIEDEIDAHVYSGQGKVFYFKNYTTDFFDLLQNNKKNEFQKP